MSRTTKAELEVLATVINNRLGLWSRTPDHGLVADERAYFVQYAYGQPRLMRDGGAVDVSPRLPAGQLADWMRAFLDGIDAAERAHTVPPLQPLPDTGAGASVEAYRG